MIGIFATILAFWVTVVQSKPYRVVTSSLFPICDCQVDYKTTSSPSDLSPGVSNYTPTGYHGFEINLARDAFARINWTEGADYTFECDYLSQIFSSLEKENSPYNASFSAMPGFTQYFDSYQFTRVPSGQGGFSIVYRRRKPPSLLLRSSDALFWFWSLIFFPLMCGGLKYWLDERREALRFYIFDTFSIYFKVADAQMSEPPAKLFHIVMSFSFTIVLLACFETYLVNSLLGEKAASSVSSLRDIRGKKIMSWNFTPLVKTLSGSGARVKWISFDLDIPQTLEAFLGQNHADFLILDYLIADYVQKTHCNLYSVISNVVPFDYYGIFPPSGDPNLIRDISIAMAQASESMTNKERLTKSYENTQIEFCSEKIFFGLRDKIYVEDMSYIFLIVFVSLFFGLVGFTVREVSFYFTDNVVPSLLRGIRQNQYTELLNQLSILMGIRLGWSAKRVRMRRFSSAKLRTVAEKFYRKKIDEIYFQVKEGIIVKDNRLDFQLDTFSPLIHDILTRDDVLEPPGFFDFKCNTKLYR
eukprot:TRINITY_DN19647_c0_g1_i1.p1 TRINITY_DN19647_c0_g1~~TRINITY_DN19647_c0_g1_i1.p1  ORF type:complete len:529 (-),score=54.85 TRINITY_DN19647_c0_g1_i1:12-1598(-)